MVERQTPNREAVGFETQSSGYSIPCLITISHKVLQKLNKYRAETAMTNSEENECLIKLTEIQSSMLPLSLFHIPPSQTSP